MSNFIFTNQFYNDEKGRTLPKARLYFYDNNTFNFTDVYSDPALTQVLDNPVTADGAGRFPQIFMDISKTYRVWLKDRNDVQVTPYIDDYSPSASSDLIFNSKADTFADLRTIEPVFENQVITLIGHTAAGVGGGTFRAVLDASGLTDDNGVTAVTVGGSGWVRQDVGYITPEMFGVIFDGSNQTTKFGNFMDYIKLNGSNGILSENTYNVKFFFTSDGVEPWSLKGAGKNKTIIKSTDGNGTMINGGSGSSVAFDIGGFTLDAQYSVYKAGGATGGSGLSIQDVNNCSFYDIHVMDYLNNAMLVFSTSGLIENIEFRECSCDGNIIAGNGLLIVNCDNASIIDCYAENVQETEGSGAGIGLQLKEDCVNSRISGGGTKNCLTGIGFGFESGADGVTRSYISNVTSDGDINACRIHGADNVIDIIANMGNSGEQCVDMQDNAFRNNIKVTCKSLAISKGIIRFRSGSSDNYCEVVGSDIDNISGAKYALFDSLSLRNIVSVVSADTAQLNASGYRNYFQFNGTTTNKGIIENITPVHTFNAINSGSITIDNLGYTMILVDTEGAAATDDLVSINSGLSDGSIFIIRAVSGSRDVVIKNGTGNILTKSGSDITLADRESSVQLQYLSSVNKYIEI